MSAGPFKVCMLGDFGVGKTSLVSRFVRSTFSDKYMTTVGVKVDSKEIVRPGRDPAKLVLWDIAGRNALDSVSANYLRGASALLIVADGTREASLAAALNLLMQARGLLPNALAVLAINKFDLLDRWEIAPPTLTQLRRAMTVFKTSAATGSGVEEAFAAILAGLDP